jgi:hypothetical protein
VEPVLDFQWLRTSSNILWALVCCIERRLASIDHLVTDFPGGKDTGGAFQAKDLLDALPLLAKPVVEIGATGELSMLQPPVALRPRLRLPPASAIWGAIGKQIGNILDEGGLVVRGLEHIRSPILLDQRTQLPLGMHRIQSDNPPFDQGRRDERLEGTDLILLLADMALPQHRSGRHVITTEQMNRMGLLARCTKGFSIDGELGVIEIALAGLKPTGFASAPLPCLEAE